MSIEKKVKSIIITGPTASGKTGMSLEVAELCGGELLSCDSMQIYRKMDIGTAKIGEQEKNGIPHHLIDSAEPWEEFSVADYCKKAYDCVLNLDSKGKTPVFVGGTGLYVTSLVEGFTFKRYLQAIYSITTQPATAVTMVIRAFSPNKAIATNPAGIKEMITSRMIDTVFVGEYM